VRGAKELEEPLRSFLAPFPEANPLPLVDLRVDDSKRAGQPKLIYASFGTLVNTDIEPFLKVIDGVKALNRSNPNNQFKFLISTGDISYANFQKMIEDKQIEIPSNLLLMPNVPQLDVLKRASLFITHSGQGSTSESIHYGVPMVCIPVMGDQPAVAYRTADELGLGVQLNFDEFDGQAVKEAALTVLNEKSYLERVLLFSQISRKYQGTKEATRITIEYLHSKSKSD
jgi:MGT family glycosyltransferase